MAAEPLGRNHRTLGVAYWRLWSSSGLSNLADGIVKVALPLVAVNYTRSPVLIAGLAFVLTLPWLLFALPAGALADRVDRRKIMLGANAVRAVLLAALVVTVRLDISSIWSLYVVAVCIGVAETVYDISAQSILPQVVRREQLSRANSRLHAAELTANEFVGPTLAGFLVTASAALAFGSSVALWGAAVAALLLVAGPFRIERKQRTTMRVDIAEGLRFLWSNRLLRTFAVMTGVFNFATSATFSILVLYVVGPESAVRSSAPAFGVLLAAVAAGSLIGSFVTEWIESALGRARALAASILVSALLVGVPAVTANPFVIGAGFFLGGAGIIVWNIIAVSLRQRITPDRLLGRVNSGHRLVAWGTKPLGALAGGLLAQVFGLRTVFAVMAVLVLTLVTGTAIVTNERMDATERDAAPS